MVRMNVIAVAHMLWGAANPAASETSGIQTRQSSGIYQLLSSFALCENCKGNHSHGNGKLRGFASVSGRSHRPGRRGSKRAWKKDWHAPDHGPPVIISPHRPRQILQPQD